jgi:hypothetical protein
MWDVFPYFKTKEQIRRVPTCAQQITGLNEQQITGWNMRTGHGFQHGHSRSRVPTWAQQITGLNEQQITAWNMRTTDQFL